jgi:hypothetical protein
MCHENSIFDSRSTFKVKKMTAENSEKQPREKKKTIERAALDLSLHLGSPNHELPFEPSLLV